MFMKFKVKRDYEGGDSPQGHPDSSYIWALPGVNMVIVNSPAMDGWDFYYANIL